MMGLKYIVAGRNTGKLLSVRQKAMKRMHNDVEEKYYATRAANLRRCDTLRYAGT
jgi:hypothetical protein